MREEKEEAIPVNVKQNVQMLVNALESARQIVGYQIREKNYPSDLGLHCGPGKAMMQNPTLVIYIAKAENAIVGKYVKDVINKSAALIQRDLDEIKEILK